MAFRKGRQEPSGEFFSFNRHDAEGRILRYAAAEEWKERAATLSRQRGRHPGIHPEVKCGGDVRHAGEVYRLMVMGARNIDEQLFGQGVGDRLIISYDRAVERDRRKAAGYGEPVRDKPEQHTSTLEAVSDSHILRKKSDGRKEVPC